MTEAMTPTPDPNEDFCRKLCEEFGLLVYEDSDYGVLFVDENAVYALRRAIRIVMEKAAREIQGLHIEVDSSHWRAALKRSEDKVRSLQLSAEDVRTEGK